jgi:hypothetical protein
MVKSKLKQALERHKGVDQKLEKQKKLRKEAEKKTRVKELKKAKKQVLEEEEEEEEGNPFIDGEAEEDEAESAEEGAGWETDEEEGGILVSAESLILCILTKQCAARFRAIKRQRQLFRRGRSSSNKRQDSYQWRRPRRPSRRGRRGRRRRRHSTLRHRITCLGRKGRRNSTSAPHYQQYYRTSSSTQTLRSPNFQTPILGSSDCNHCRTNLYTRH